MNDIDYYQKLARQLMFELSDEEAKEVQKRFETFEKQLELLEGIDTSNVEAMVYPFEMGTSYLREDRVDEVLSQADVLLNAPKQKEAHFVVPKVVK